MPEKIDAKDKEFEKFREGLVAATQNEAQMLYVESKSDQYGARINRALLQRVYGQENEGF